MNLAAMLSAHDAAALEALTNKGLVRRAMRDIEAGRVRQLDETRVEVEDQTVTLTPESPRSQDCPCSATGVCRHTVTAILFLRDKAPPDAATHVPILSAREEILALCEADITRFAGGDFAPALILAAAGAEAVQEGEMLVVTLSDASHPVQFIPGKGPSGAVFKGAASRKRLMVTAALLAFRSAEGLALSEMPDAGTDREALPVAFLEEVDTAIARLVGAVLRGGAELVIEDLFDLAISARAQAAPRLTGALRALIAEARRGQTRHVEFEPETFLTEAAQISALCQALKQTPDDPELKGVLQREYRAADPMTLWVLGAERWSTPAGARGVRVYGYDPQGQRWIKAGHARAAGRDPDFTPEQGYRQTLLNAGTAHSLTGACVDLPEPRLSNDLQLAPSVAGQKTGDLIWDDLGHAGVIHTDWSAASADIQMRLGGGLRERDGSVPILLAPHSITAATFDDMAQTYLIGVNDAQKDQIFLTLTSEQGLCARWLPSVGRNLLGLLCTASRASEGLVVTPITAFVRERGKLTYYNLGYDQLPSVTGLKEKIFAKFSSLKTPAPISTTSELARLRQDIMSATVDKLQGGGGPSIALHKRAEAFGLTTVVALLDTFERHPTPHNALRLAYVMKRVAELG